MPRVAGTNAPHPSAAMTADLQVITEPLGGGALARAAIEGRTPDGWLEPRPRGAEGWRRQAERVRQSVPRDAIARLMPAIAPTGAAAARLERAAERGIVVTTGQQPGLFGGPIYTWSKAVSALALADAIEEATGIPAAPLFWAATDDADFAEAAGTTIAVPGGWERLAITSSVGAETPMSEVPLPDVSSQLERLARAAGSAPHAAALDATRSAYRDGATVGGAYVALLRALLEPLGIAVLDASHPALLDAARPTLVRALERCSALETALAARDREISAAGFETQVPLVGGLTLVHRVHEGARRRIPLREAAAAAADSASRLGATVLVRPVMERAILPTAAYVAGPGEIAYFAQASAVADALGAERPLTVPRWSTTIVEPHVARLLARLGIERDELARPDVVETRLARAAMPAEVARELQAMREAAARGTQALARAAGEHALPDAVYEGARRQLEARIERLERRHVAAQKRRSDEMLRDVGTLRGALYPGGKRQERALNFIPLLARHGPALLERMREQAAVHARALIGG